VGKIVAAVSPTAPITFSILVNGKDDAALPALAKSVSDPASPDFRHFLSRAQMAAQIDPSAATTNAVVAGLRALGITVVRVSSDGRLVDAQAPAGVLSTALGLRFANVQGQAGAIERVVLNQPAFPAALRPLISDVIGLSATPVSTFETVGPVTVTSAPNAAYFNGRPCSEPSYGAQIATAQPSYQGQKQPYTICGYSPEQIRAAYRVPETGLTGKGVRIGIVDDYASPTMVADVNQYSTAHGLPLLAAGQYINNTDPVTQRVPEIDVSTPPSLLGSVPLESPQTWSEEQSLDVEMVHTMAPAATIEYYGGIQGIGLQPLEAEFAIAIADDQAQFITDSWGIGENDELVTPADFAFMDLELELGAIEGVGASFSTGDDGDNIEVNDVKEADFPASTSLATAVGGTTLVMGPNDTYIGETYWGTRLEPETKNGQGWDATPVSASTSIGPPTGPGSLAGAGGGGVSAHYAEPYWQQGVVPDSLTTQHYTSPDKQNTNNVTSPGRVLPDISLDADSTTGVLVGQTQTDVDGVARYSEFRIGGTSVSSPLFAGLMALAIQYNGGKSLGFVSPALYAAYIKSPDAFRKPFDNTPINVRTDYTDTQNPNSPLIFHLRLLGQLSSLHWLKGYDDSTGLGSPCASAFIPAIVAPNVALGAGAGCGAPLS
jgi:subtilase family serine protease